ncbi:Predicted O-methyltransferase YrrM [Pedobacter steynii]|uniref:Predicted O-methyltransferase YrrM n=1 Tax=Pedobacter steynii TaxID=430522 RepID=A0A1H0FHT4_9SPHI|nr:class I SAM-dependent methyltransferase [Pedobacter steynii]NQX42101.1 class I SAM-dependent methyltransferase [Pedobacter steynii]SDN94235.1 Predicted O-methyltransferase YrrM [Pedobacter steynii]
MVFNFISDYLKHRFTSKSRHGTHSPFVYKLTDEVIYDFNAKSDYKSIEAQRKKLFNDDSLIQVTDLGAGSHLNKNRAKKVKQIAKNALKNPRLAQLIYRLAKDNGPKSIIELGTCLGITSAYLSKACPDADVITIEGCPETAKVAYRNFQELELDNVELRVGNFDTLLPGVIEQEPRLDFVYVDGNHRKEATINYFNWCLPKVHEGSLLIFDDIYWSEGMKEAWEEIKRHPEVTVTVDLFWIGLVYFKKGQAKEHFKIKF